MSDGKLTAGLCLTVPLCSEDVSSLFSYTEKIRADGFNAGAASRDAEVVSLTNQRDYEYVRAENAEQERDQFEQVRDQLRTEMNEWRGQAHRSQSDADRLKEENDRLRAQINAQREALNVALWFIPDHPIQPENKRRVEIVKKALSTTPEQYLDEYRNKVIEAFVNEFSRHVGGDGEFWLHELQYFAMKEQP